MYVGDKRVRITVRLNERQFDFVRRSAEMLDVSPSDFLRMVINTTMCASDKLAQDNPDKIIVGAENGKNGKNDKEGSGRENDKANQHS